MLVPDGCDANLQVQQLALCRPADCVVALLGARTCRRSRGIPASGIIAVRLRDHRRCGQRGIVEPQEGNLRRLWFSRSGKVAKSIEARYKHPPRFSAQFANSPDSGPREISTCPTSPGWSMAVLSDSIWL